MKTEASSVELKVKVKEEIFVISESLLRSESKQNEDWKVK